jgi:hypothetical protein
MDARTRLFTAIGSALIIALGPGARISGAQQPQGPVVIGSYYPT